MFNKKKRIEELEVKVKRLGCKHGDYKYSTYQCPWTNVRLYEKKCTHCGHAVGLTHEAWCQEQADAFYKLHEHWIDMINKSEPTSPKAGSIIYYTP